MDKSALQVVDLTKVIESGQSAHVTTLITPLRRHGDGLDEFDPPCRGYTTNLVFSATTRARIWTRLFTSSRPV
jgi:hypothetical protein